MAKSYELSVYRRNFNSLMGVMTLTDADGNANDRWEFKGDGAISLNSVHSGTWFRTESSSKVTLAGDDDRIAGDFKYHSWPLASNTVGHLRTIREIRLGGSGDYFYVVEGVS